MPFIFIPDKPRMGKLRRRGNKGNKARYRLSQAGGGNSTFSPNQVAGILGWWRADDIPLNDNDPVATWLDLSPNSNDLTQGTAANRPILKTSQINGHDIVRLDGTNDDMTSANNCPSGNNPHALFIVAKWNSFATLKGIFAWGAESSDNYRSARTDTNGDVVFFFYFDDLSVDANLVVGTPALLTFLFSGSNRFVRKNGSQIATDAATTNTTAGQLRLGVSEEAQPRMSADIAEVILYNAVPSASDLTSIENYLISRYAIS